MANKKIILEEVVDKYPVWTGKSWTWVIVYKRIN